MDTLTLERHWLRASKILRAKFGPRTKTYFHHRVAQYRTLWSEAAKACGASFAVVADDVWWIERDGVGACFRNHEVQLDDPVVLEMAGRKPLMHRLLSEAGLRVPDHLEFELSDLDPAMGFLKAHPDGIVIKPANGSAAGDGVTTHVQTAKEARRASVLASLYDYTMLAEAQLPGESYRALVVGGRMLQVVCRRGPRLTGNGRLTVAELIAEDNRRRATEGLPRIQIDRDCRFTLSWQDLNPESVPEDGRDVLVRAVENPEGGANEVRTVYNAEVTEAICDSIRRDVEETARILDSDLVGVDLILTDPSLPLHEGGGCINEVNTTPALHHHYRSEESDYPQLAIDVIELVLKRKAARMPAAPGAQQG